MKKNKRHSILIDDLDTLKVIADPLRSQILELLVQEALTVKKLAEKLGLSPSKLYYHINMLEKHNLIEVVETRIVANMLEKHYHASATHLDIDPNLLSFITPEGKENINAILTSTLETTFEDLVRSLEARALDLEHGVPEEPRRASINRTLSRITPERADEFHKRLMVLVQEFEKADNTSADEIDESQSYALTIAFYPSFYFKDYDKGTG